MTTELSLQRHEAGTYAATVKQTFTSVTGEVIVPEHMVSMPGLTCDEQDFSTAQDGSLRLAHLKCTQRHYDDRGFAKTLRVNPSQSATGYALLEITWKGRPNAWRADDGGEGVSVAVAASAAQCRLSVTP
jgi:hypothetical protein